jgi:tetratricopeptide (TPR) repeat protein
VFRLACEEHYADAAAALGERVRHGTPDEREDARWWQVIAERYAGKLEAAARNARELADVPGTLYQHLLLEGRSRSRAAARASRVEVRAGRRPHSRCACTSICHPARAARATAARAWGVTHVCRRARGRGELDRAWALTDTIAMLTRHEVSERGRALPHYARGVVLAARARREEAVNPAAAAALRETAIGELRQGLGHPVRGLVAARLTLGRLLTADGRAAEALAVLRPAAWRGLDDANRLYVSAPEVRLALAEAYDAAGQRDSAVAEYRRVLRAWRHADARFDARRAHAAARVARLARSVAVADAPRPTR